MNKILFSLILFFPFCAPAMRPHNQSDIDAERLAKHFGGMFTAVSKAKVFKTRTIIALTESQMNGTCIALKVFEIVKLEFSDVEKSKHYACAVQSANQALDEHVTEYLAEINNKFSDNPRYDFPIELLKKKFKVDPFSDVNENELKEVQLGRFISFITYQDLTDYLGACEQRLRICRDDFIEIQNSKKLELQRIREQIEKAKINRAVLQLALAAGNLKGINESRTKLLHVTPFIPLHEYIVNLRKEAAKGSGK